MIDLKELERRLDEALAQETSESLSNWLFEQRANNLANIYGKGSIEEFEGNPHSFKQSPIPEVYFKGVSENIPDNKFAIAA